ncbi:MAG: hypothetical protein BalsKO_04010 [Balneolaceae bacterium]
MLLKKREREGAEINGSSMADIAFLLLIFFLVTTTINVDTGYWDGSSSAVRSGS